MSMEGIVHLSPLVIKFGRINFAMDLSPRQAPGHDASITAYALASLPVDQAPREVPFRLRKEGYPLPFWGRLGLSLAGTLAFLQKETGRAL